MIEEEQIFKAVGRNVKEEGRPSTRRADVG